MKEIEYLTKEQIENIGNHLAKMQHYIVLGISDEGKSYISAAENEPMGITQCIFAILTTDNEELQNIKEKMILGFLASADVSKNVRDHARTFLDSIDNREKISKNELN